MIPPFRLKIFHVTKIPSLSFAYQIIFLINPTKTPCANKKNTWISGYIDPFQHRRSMTFKPFFPHQNMDKTPLFNEVRGMMSKFTVKASVEKNRATPTGVVFKSHQKKILPNMWLTCQVHPGRLTAGT